MNKETALHLSCRLGHANACGYILPLVSKSPGCLLLRDSSGLTALHWSLEKMPNTLFPRFLELLDDDENIKEEVISIQQERAQLAKEQQVRNQQEHAARERRKGARKEEKEERARRELEEKHRKEREIEKKSKELWEQEWWDKKERQRKNKLIAILVGLVVLVLLFGFFKIAEKYKLGGKEHSLPKF